MARILRGEVRWADLNPVRGREQAGLSTAPPEEIAQIVEGFKRNHRYLV